MLIENTLFGKIDRISYAIAQLKLHEPAEGYYVSFSGGKDSCVVLDLVKRSGVKYDAHYNVTTVDPKELVKFIYEKHHDDVIMEKPEMPMWKLIEKKGIMPTRIIRYCCAVYKENGGRGRNTIITGIRKQESNSRKKWSMVEPCNNRKGTQFLHIIIDWSTKDVWDYIKKYNVPYCTLYDNGWKRIGCVGCPFANPKQRKWELDKNPQIEKIWKRGCKAVFDKWVKEGKEIPFKDEVELYNWWLSNKSIKKYKNQLRSLYGLMGDESML